MKKVPLIFDCDNTLGIQGCDIDDGMTLLYLLGSEEVDLLGVTCSYGNNQQDVVYENTVRLLKDWQRENIPVFKGCAKGEDRHSEAAKFLAETAEKTEDLHLLVTGSCGNLLGAQEINPNFFQKIKQASFMGGVTGPFYVNNVSMDELNFSCDPEASYAALSQIPKVRIATAPNCLQSYFLKEDFLERVKATDHPVAEYLVREIAYWYELHETKWKLSGIVNWDVMAAAQLLHPELFNLNQDLITPTVDSLSQGLLFSQGQDIQVELPSIRSLKDYLDHVYSRYFNAQVLNWQI